MVVLGGKRTLLLHIFRHVNLAAERKSADGGGVGVMKGEVGSVCIYKGIEDKKGVECTTAIFGVGGL